MTRGELVGIFEVHCGIKECSEYVTTTAIGIDDAGNVIRDLDWGKFPLPLGWLCPEHAFDRLEEVLA